MPLVERPRPQQVRVRNKMIELKRTAACFVVMTVVSCGGGQPADSAADVDNEGSAVNEGGDSSSDGAAGPELAWADMNREQRMEFMGLTVLPEMKKLFQEADPAGYADFKCQTCHVPLSSPISDFPPSN